MQGTVASLHLLLQALKDPTPAVVIAGQQSLRVWLQSHPAHHFHVTYLKSCTCHCVVHSLEFDRAREVEEQGMKTDTWPHVTPSTHNLAVAAPEALNVGAICFAFFTVLSRRAVFAVLWLLLILACQLTAGRHCSTVLHGPSQLRHHQHHRGP